MSYALGKVAKDWDVCKQAVINRMTNIIKEEECEYKLLLRYSLPYKYYLLYAYITG